MTYQKNATPEPLASTETMPPLPPGVYRVPSIDTRDPKWAGYSAHQVYEYARAYAAQAVAAEMEAFYLEYRKLLHEAEKWYDDARGGGVVEMDWHMDAMNVLARYQIASIRARSNP